METIFITAAAIQMVAIVALVALALLSGHRKRPTRGDVHQILSEEDQ